MNFAALQHSLVQNNLIYNNLAHGIASWNDRNPFDEAAVNTPPETMDEAKDPKRLPMFGCHDNVIRNNTVLMANSGRAAVLLVNGSYGARLRNNLLLNDADASVEVDRTSLFRLDAGRSVLGEVWYRNAPFGVASKEMMPESLLGAMIARVDEPGSPLHLTQEKIASHLMGPSREPWVIEESSWWKLNPQRPDFRPKKGSSLLAGAGDKSDMPASDLWGAPRKSADIGALSAEGPPP